jgi:hypothetical protein
MIVVDQFRWHGRFFLVLDDGTILEVIMPTPFTNDWIYQEIVRL